MHPTAAADKDVDRPPARLFENPEIAAMTAIADLLQALPDEAARMRVMHWAFGRFSEDFKRPAAAPAPLPPAEAPSRPTGSALRPILRSIGGIPSPANPMLPPRFAPHEGLEVDADLMPAELPEHAVRSDFGHQISELDELFADPSHAQSLERGA